MEGIELCVEVNKTEFLGKLVSVASATRHILVNYFAANPKHERKNVFACSSMVSFNGVILNRHCTKESKFVGQYITMP